MNYDSVPRPDPVETSAMLDLLWGGTDLRGIPAEEFDAATTYRVAYDFTPSGIDTYDLVCIETLGGSYPGKAQTLPMCDELAEAVAPFWSGIPATGAYQAPSKALYMPGGYGAGSGGSTTGGGILVSHGSATTRFVERIERETHHKTITIVETPPPYAAPVPVPLPAAGLLLGLALLSTLVLARKRR